MSIKITKMQGCGNDFVILDYEEFLKMNCEMDEAARKLCDRNFGIGADGLIIPNTSIEDADIGWYFYNSDGSTAQMCGNGMRCFAKYVYDKKLVDKTEFTVKTLAGIMTPQIMDDGQVRVNMSKPILDSEKIPFLPNHNLNYKISVKNRIFEGNAISMGNPHFVIFIKDDENLLELAKKYGPEIELSAEFPEKTNVEFIKIKSHKKIELCVWERGCGITLACGTGACASVVAGILNGLLENSVDVILLGGTVNVTWNGTPHKPDGDVFLTGPAEYVFEAILN
jgi:diaminopimelate epimerase